MGIEIKSKFSSMDEILKNIKSQIEENPQIFTTQNKGKEMNISCPTCKEKRIATILKDGKCRCNECKTEFKLELDINIVK